MASAKALAAHRQQGLNLVAGWRRGVEMTSYNSRMASTLSCSAACCSANCWLVASACSLAAAND
jgi:hypothetical protein